MKPIQQGDEYVIEWNGYKAVAPTEALCIRVFEEMLLENARIEVAKAANTVISDQPSDTFCLLEIKKFPHPIFRDNE